MKYHNYLRTISERFTAKFDEIAAEYNFDYGPEYEIAICKMLRLVLPERFGICRGFIVTPNDKKAGDDIIIYNRNRFPTLRLIDNIGFAQKEYIPVEAVCAYIEAKHSLVIEGDGGQSLVKAAAQVATAKGLPREPVTAQTALDPYLYLPITAPERVEYPKVYNLLFVAIFARQIRKTANSAPLNSSKEIKQALLDSNYHPDKVHPPDLIVAGNDVALIPFIETSSTLRTYASPFCLPNSQLMVCECKGLAFALGICSLLYALDTIRLGKMPWPSIIGETLGIEPPDDFI